MNLCKTVLDAIAAAIAAITALTGAAGTERKVFLFTSNVTPNEDTVPGDLAKATFDGYADRNVDSTTLAFFNDPLSGQRKLHMTPLTTGFTWITTGVTALPQTIYGYALTTNSDSAILAWKLFPTPIVLNAIGQGVEIGGVDVPFDENFGNNE